MRDLLDHADLARYAGQFVWLELSYDEPANRAFLTKYGANATPTFFVIDPSDEHVTAMQPGAMSLQELTQFLERGAAGVLAKKQLPVDIELAKADALLADQPAEAAKAYEHALQVSPAGWPQRHLAEALLVEALQDSHEYQRCAETAAREAGQMKRDVFFVRTVVGGMWCLASVDSSPWTDAALTKLTPMAEQALTLAITVRDHRDSIYRTLMIISVNHGDNAAAARYGDRWFAELDAVKPHSDEERSALDIARVENIQVYGDPNRVIPALKNSERAMPKDYIASLRLAQMEHAARHYDEAVAACNRGLGRTPGAAGRAWLLEIEAQILNDQGKTAEARRTWETALAAAQEIPSAKSREMNITMIQRMLKAPEK
jgi:tetratricopeptide (TPR) repeat protein